MPQRREDQPSTVGRDDHVRASDFLGFDHYGARLRIGTQGGGQKLPRREGEGRSESHGFEESAHHESLLLFLGRQTFVTLDLAAAVGVYLIYAGGWPILLIGLASILSLLAYSGGPYPLASHGLGDLFVFIFFGPVAVSGTYYVQALHLTWQAILVAIPVGLLITAILAINNLRDINTDHQAGKYTLAVILGDRGARIEYVLLLASAYAIPGVFWLTGLAPRWVLLPVISLPIGLYMIRFTWLNSA